MARRVSDQNVAIIICLACFTAVVLVAIPLFLVILKPSPPQPPVPVVKRTTDPPTPNRRPKTTKVVPDTPVVVRPEPSLPETKLQPYRVPNAWDWPRGQVCA